MMIRLSLGVTLLSLLFAAPASAQNFVRMEMIPIQTVTLSAQQILAGETAGKPAIVAGNCASPRPGPTSCPRSSWCTALAA